MSSQMMGVDIAGAGRTVFQAPEVDGITYVHKERLTVGDFADVRISDSMEYDLIGEAL